MLFVDLNELKIKKDYSFQTSYLHLCAPGLEAPIGAIRHAFADEMKSAWNAKEGRALPGNYEIAIGDEGGVATDEEIEAFETWVNLLLLDFFDFMTTSVKRARENRLDVPKKLKNVHCAMGLLKKAVNFETIRDVFNLTITYKDLTFTLVDAESKDEPEEEFIHSADEAPELKESIDE